MRELVRGAQLFGEGHIADEIRFIIVEPYPSLYKHSLIALMIARMGWIAFAFIMTMIAVFCVKGISSCLNQKSSLGLFMSLAVICTFVLQVVDYVIYNLGFALTGMNPSLPLISNYNASTVVKLDPNWTYALNIPFWRCRCGQRPPYRHNTYRTLLVDQ